MTIRLIHADDLPTVPWHNGGGHTRELLRWPDGDGWQLRLSMADIDRDGPFSALPGVQRWIATLDGDGIELALPGGSQVLRAGDPPLCFEGATAPHCRLLGGRTRDLNLMLRDAGGAMQPVSAGAAWLAGSRGCGLFAAVAGEWACDGGRRLALPARTLLWMDTAPEPPQTFHPHAPAIVAGWWLRFTPGADR